MSRLVNALFFREGEVLSPEFEEAMKASFGADVSSLTPTEIERVNGFVEKATEGKIKKVLTEISPLMKMILVSASYFKDGWKHPMKERQTKPGDFFPAGSKGAGANGPSSSYLVDMMKSVGQHGYFDAPTFEVVEMALNGPYVSEKLSGHALRPRYSAILFLPKDHSSLLDILPALQGPGMLDEIVSQKMNRTQDIEVFVPKFNFTWDGDLIPVLKGMGLLAPFGDGSDFSKILQTTPGGDIAISQVRTSGFVEFNEEGIAGGGAAVVEMSLRGGGFEKPDRKILFDHPFLLVLRDNELGFTFLEVVVSRPNPSSQNSRSIR
ncbi:MAG: hypothetical protein IPK68_23215 [Bdellovibrionales bacterium]|nr:hypothetical protein [Bdellovibrionales bacterium]